MRLFNPYDSQIIRALVNSRRKLSTLQISKATRISYNTTKKHLEDLEKEGTVKNRSIGRKNQWWIEEED